MSDFITTQEASKIIGLKVRRIRQMCNEGKLQAVKFGRDWQIERASVEQYAAAHKPKREAAQ
jgi:excisionase family DNA binding protein